MKKLVIGIIVTLMLAALLVAGKQAFSYIYNEILINEYENGIYSALDTDPLFVGNWFEPYIAHYNEGNVCYQRKHYEEAIEEYKTALTLNPPEDRECFIRINLALAMIYNMGEDYAAPENVPSSIETLKEARDILLAEGCATDDGNGHNEEAQKLKEEIDDLIEQLEQQQQQQQTSSSSEGEEEQEEQQEQESETEEEEDFEEEVQEQLQQTQQEALEEREENLESYEESNWSSDYEGIW